MKKKITSEDHKKENHFLENQTGMSQDLKMMTLGQR